MKYSDKELAINWWNKLSTKDKINVMNKFKISHTNLSLSQINWLWHAQQQL